MENCSSQFYAHCCINNSWIDGVAGVSFSTAATTGRPQMARQIAYNSSVNSKILPRADQIVPMSYSNNEWQVDVKTRCKVRYDTICYFNVRSKADTSQLNLPHGNDN